MKEGHSEDFANREKIAKLFRFNSTHEASDAQVVSLKDYVARMKDGQEAIYYITADSYEAAKHSPHLEIFKKKGIEVLLMSDRVDEWLLSTFNAFEGKKLQSIAKGDLDLRKSRRMRNPSLKKFKKR
jgi:molecular chaperone HtpG